MNRWQTKETNRLDPIAKQLVFLKRGAEGPLTYIHTQNIYLLDKYFYYEFIRSITTLKSS